MSQETEINLEKQGDIMVFDIQKDLKEILMEIFRLYLKR